MNSSAPNVTTKSGPRIETENQNFDGKRSLLIHIRISGFFTFYQAQTGMHKCYILLSLKKFDKLLPSFPGAAYIQVSGAKQLLQKIKTTPTGQEE